MPLFFLTACQILLKNNRGAERAKRSENWTDKESHRQAEPVLPGGEVLHTDRRIGKGQKITGFLPGNTVISIQISCGFGAHGIAAENSHEKTVASHGSKSEDRLPESTGKRQELFQKLGFYKKS